MTAVATDTYVHESEDKIHPLPQDSEHSIFDSPSYHRMRSGESEVTMKFSSNGSGEGDNSPHDVYDALSIIRR